MTRYDFDQLTPFDFELVVRDLLGAEWNLPLETFTLGRDTGIDIRYIGPNSGVTELIVQCKKLQSNAFSRLRRELVKEELPKVNILRPKRYVLATSVELTPNRKEELVSALRPWVRSANDVLGRDDLNNRLRDHPAVERAHLKLWLSSTVVLEKVLHSDIYRRSQRFQDEVERVRQTYVENSSYQTARKMLAKNHVCIISGDPGIGKTTLATMIAVAYLDRGDWEVVHLSGDIAEADRVWRTDTKQLFYYDDFLGRVALSGVSLAKNEDARILDVIAEVRRDPKKRLLLTTREYILAAARLVYDRLNVPAIGINRYVMRPSSYSLWQRALILYNHLYMSPLQDETKLSFIQSGRYMAVIKHPSYSPRLMDHMTTSPQAQRVSSNEFSDFALRVLDNPEELWLHILETDLDTEARSILIALVSLPETVHVDDAQQASESYSRLSPVGPRVDFGQALRILEGGNFIKIALHNDRSTVALRDPSVLDFLVNWLAGHRSELTRLLQSAVYFEQCTILIDYSSGIPALKRRLQRPNAAPPRLVLDGEALVLAMCRTLWAPPRNSLTYSEIPWTRPKSANVVERLGLIVKWALELDTITVVDAASKAIDSVERRIGADGLSAEGLVKIFGSASHATGALRDALGRARATLVSELLSTSTIRRPTQRFLLCTQSGRHC